MIFPNVSPKEWIKKYPILKITKYRCRQCKDTIKIDIPFITKHYAGFISRDCTCKKLPGRSVYTTRTNEAKKLFNTFFEVEE